jgi:phosphoenolpyruvate carboxykinase (ATP)
MTDSFNLQDYGLTVAEIHRNLPLGALYEHAIRHEKDASIADNGALAAHSGVKAGRSPKDKRVVKHPQSEADVWWGPVNIPIEPHTYAINRERAQDYLNSVERLLLRGRLCRLGPEVPLQGARHLLAALPTPYSCARC